jgi:PHD/YefM family antitoxin component YafN of YafNO toxin-antitoxin module
MINIRTITARDILRNYKAVFEKIKKTKEPAVVVAQNEPPVAIVSLDDLEQLKQLRYRQSAKALLELSRKVGKLIRDSGEKLPADLSVNHDKYLYEE